MATSSCSPPSTGCSTDNTASRTTISGYTIKYGGGGGPDDYSVLTTWFHNDFVTDCDNWAANFNWYAATFRGTGLSWIGHIGTAACNRPSWHRFRKAWDLNHVRFDDGTYLDFVRSSEAYASSSRAERRLHLAVNASLKRYFGVVIDGIAEPTLHHNHMHVDESCGSVSAPYTPSGSYSDDTKFIQYLCNDFNSAGISQDGIWGNNTSAAWGGLLNALNMQCLDPRVYSSSWKTFLGYVMRHGVANRSAGHWRYSCSGPFAAP